jgi:hypothetical protein
MQAAGCCRIQSLYSYRMQQQLMMFAVASIAASRTPAASVSSHITDRPAIRRRPLLALQPHSQQ